MNKSFIKRQIVRARKEAGLSQVELSRKIGKSDKYISHIESDRNITLDALDLIAQATGKPLPYFLIEAKTADYNARIEKLNEAEKNLLEALLESFGV